MAAKGFNILFLVTLAGHFASQQAAAQRSSYRVAPFSEVVQAAGSNYGLPDRKIKIGQPMTMKVRQEAAVAVPIAFTAGDYQGPYDPADPKGVLAAARRRARIEGHATMQQIKSYIPPGSAKFAKKEVIKLAMDEGRRFAVAHPKETAELVGIATKAKSFYTTTSHKLKELERKQAEGH